jgi:hypothetical protein
VFIDSWFHEDCNELPFSFEFFVGALLAVFEHKFEGIVVPLKLEFGVEVATETVEYGFDGGIFAGIMESHFPKAVLEGVGAGEFLALGDEFVEAVGEELSGGRFGVELGEEGPSAEVEQLAGFLGGEGAEGGEFVGDFGELAEIYAFESVLDLALFALSLFRLFGCIFG